MNGQSRPPGSWVLPRQWRELEDAELASEFRAHPFGPHSALLSRLLLVMKGLPLPGRPVIVYSRDGTCEVAELPARPGNALVFHGPPLPADNLAEAERQAFALRWRALFENEVPW